VNPRPRSKPDLRLRRWPVGSGLVVVGVAVGVVVLVAAPAALAGTHGSAAGAGGGGGVLSVPFGLFGISVSGILRTIAKLLFNVLAGAFLPGWLRNAPREALTWLIALPNPADAVQWPTMHRLEQDTTAVAVAILPMTFAISAARYTASGVTGGAHHPAESIGRLLGAAIGLLLFGWGFENAVAAVNVTTSALLSFGSIDHGLQRALTLMFAGGLAFGVTGPLIALLVIAAILLAAGLFMIKVGVLAAFAILYVGGPLALSLTPVPELHGVWRVWFGVLIALALIPVGWCLMFAVSGAISADITHIGTPAAIGTRLVGFFAGVLTFFLAFRWPFFLISLVRARGLLSPETLAGSSGGGSPARSGGGGLIERVGQSRAALSAAAGTLGSAVSHAGSALGAPSGGFAPWAAGAGARTAGRTAARAGTALSASPLALRGRRALDSSWQTVRARAGESRLANRGVVRTAGQRVSAAGSVLGAGPSAAGAAAGAVLDNRADQGNGRRIGDQILKQTLLRARERAYRADTRNAADPNTAEPRQPATPTAPNGSSRDTRSGVDAAAVTAAAAAADAARRRSSSASAAQMAPSRAKGPSTASAPLGAPAEGAPRPPAATGPLEKPPRQPPPPGRSERLGGQTPRPANPDPPQSPAPRESY
jgi:hypothetical protein